VTAAVWVFALVWTVGYCYLRGYQGHAPDGWLVRSGLAVARRPEDIGQFWGIPDWVWVGILLPWGLCSAFGVCFGLLGMEDDDLGAEGDPAGNSVRASPGPDGRRPEA
jgi:hypothetical protein